MRRISLAALLCTLALGALAEGGDGAIVYGEDWAYLIAPPPGFELDQRSLAKEGINGLFRPSGKGGFRRDELHLYVSPFPKGGDVPQDLQAFIDWDLGWYQEGNPSLRIQFEEELELGDFRPCYIFRLDDPGPGYFMLRGYAEGEKAFFVFALVARSPGERLSNEEAYGALLRSFVYMEKE
jgi:hypothetical protein